MAISSNPPSCEILHMWGTPSHEMGYQMKLKQGPESFGKFVDNTTARTLPIVTYSGEQKVVSGNYQILRCCGCKQNQPHVGNTKLEIGWA